MMIKHGDHFSWEKDKDCMSKREWYVKYQSELLWSQDIVIERV